MLNYVECYLTICTDLTNSVHGVDINLWSDVLRLQSDMEIVVWIRYKSSVLNSTFNSSK
jgi:hypothetical protein